MVIRKVQFLLVFLSRLVLTAFAYEDSAPKICKCFPTDPCWPSPTDWNSLNNTLSGRLLRTVPPASVCYPSSTNYNATACAFVVSQWTKSQFHASEPFSVDYPLWTNNSCNPIFPNGTSITGDPSAGERGCELGRGSLGYPAFVVNATTAEHVSIALKWAGERRIRVAIKNTGHSFLGRSVAYGSLSIWMHNFQGIKFHSDFTPGSCPHNSTKKQMAATLAAGTQDKQMYEELAKYDAVVVGGSNPTVGIMGWFTGGGHGPLSSQYGMGADNLLEATVVTADGQILVANECQNADLFFAIRGGGGSTYGIVTEAVMKAYPTPQTTTLTLLVQQLSPSTVGEFWDLMAYIHSKMPHLKDEGVSGYYVMSGPPLSPTLQLTSGFYLFNKPNGTAEALFAPIKQRLDNLLDLVKYSMSVLSFPTFNDSYTEPIDAEPVATGGGDMGSRLLTYRALTDDVVHVARTFEEIGPKVDGSVSSARNPTLIGHMIANSANKGLDIGLNPAWRDTVVHMIVTEGWIDGASQEEIQSVRDDITYNKTYALRQLAPDSGAYFNECDPFEHDWHYAFFGNNYYRLTDIKRKFDRDGLFWCRSCVGSDEWVETSDGHLCRVQEPEALLNVQ